MAYRLCGQAFESMANIDLDCQHPVRKFCQANLSYSTNRNQKRLTETSFRVKQKFSSPVIKWQLNSARLLVNQFGLPKAYALYSLESHWWGEVRRQGWPRSGETEETDAERVGENGTVLVPRLGVKRKKTSEAKLSSFYFLLWGGIQKELYCANQVFIDGLCSLNELLYGPPPNVQVLMGKNVS